MAATCWRRATCCELVPDLVERDVFLCGPPAMAAFIARNVREARVPKRQIHAERFALI